MHVRDALNDIDLFRALPPKALDELVAGGTTMRLRPGTELARQGSPLGGFHLIREGSAKVAVNGVERSTLSAGSYFGEMSLIDSGPRSATVVAGGEGVTTFVISPLTFSGLLDKYPGVARALLPTLTARIRAIESSAGN